MSASCFSPLLPAATTSASTKHNKEGCLNHSSDNHPRFSSFHMLLADSLIEQGGQRQSSPSLAVHPRLETPPLFGNNLYWGA